MVEKAGHKKRLMGARNEWISKGQPGNDRKDDADDSLEPGTRSAAHFSAAVNDRDGHPSTPPRDDVPDEEDLYEATPRAARQLQAPNGPGDDDDDLDALIAEAEAYGHPRQQPVAKAPLVGVPGGEDDELDALIAEAEAQQRPHDNTEKNQTRNSNEGYDDFADEEAAMQEMDGLW
jgi:replication fork protection complex subunit Csm3/Swi3